MFLPCAKFLSCQRDLALERVSKSYASSQPPPALLESWCTQQQKQETVVVSRSDPAAKKYRYHSRLLGLTVAASFSLTRGAGGFSIAPCLSISVPVSKNSPAFRTMFFYPLMAKSLDPAQFVDNTIELLKYLFEERQASPADTTSDGESLVDVGEFTFFSSLNTNLYLGRVLCVSSRFPMAQRCLYAFLKTANVFDSQWRYIR